MIVEDVRIKEKSTVIGQQREAMNVDYFDVEIKVFDNWWSLDKKAEDKRNLDEALSLRDVIMDSIHGRRQ